MLEAFREFKGPSCAPGNLLAGRRETAFQDRLLEELKRECNLQGIHIKAALVRDIQPPSEIAALISQREQADQEMERSRNEMEEAKSEAQLVIQRELRERNSELGDARTQVVTLTKQAEQRKTVAVTKAQRELQVAKLQLEAAVKEAAAVRSRGEAEANVVLFGYKAEAEPLGDGSRSVW